MKAQEFSDLVFSINESTNKKIIDHFVARLSFSNYTEKRFGRSVVVSFSSGESLVLTKDYSNFVGFNKGGGKFFEFPGFIKSIDDIIKNFSTLVHKGRGAVPVVAVNSFRKIKVEKPKDVIEGIKEIKGISIKEFKKKFHWVVRAVLKDAVFNYVDGFLVFEEGIWKRGIWHDGVWEKGIWESGIWKQGIWRSGHWHDGTWEQGTWETGVWHDGKWLSGTWKSGTWKGGNWYGGVWNDGHWENGIWFGGTWEHGNWIKGTINGEVSTLPPKN